MKKISVFICVYLWLIFLCFSISAKDFKTIQDGIEYAELTREINKTPVRMNLLRLDLTKVRLDVVHAMDAAIGTELTSSMAKRHGAIAAINAGFFRLDKSIFAGDAVGVLQIDGKLLSESQNNRIAIGIINGKNKTEVAFGHLDTKISLSMGIDTVYPISGINRERKKDEIVLFFSAFNQKTLTDDTGAEFIVKSCCPKSPNAGNVNEIFRNKGNSLIPKDGYIISTEGENEEEIKLLF